MGDNKLTVGGGGGVIPLIIRMSFRTIWVFYIPGLHFETGERHFLPVTFICSCIDIYIFFSPQGTNLKKKVI